MKNVIKLLVLSLITSILYTCSEDDIPAPANETFTDADGNIYNTLTIGNQVWAAENLKTTTYNDGTPITEFMFGMDWNALGSANNGVGLFQWATTDPSLNLPDNYYGGLYNYFAVESGKLIPDGWRLPTVQDFMDLENHLENNGFAGRVATALKSTTNWSAFAGSGTDDVNFRGLPNGYIASGGTSTVVGGICSWLTADVQTGPINSSLTRKWIQLFDEADMLYTDNSIVLGGGIRLIKE